MNKQYGVKVGTSSEDSSKVGTPSEDSVSEDSSKVGTPSEDSSKVGTSEQQKLRMKKSELEEMIKNACLTEYKSLEEISVAVQRDSRYLREKVLPDMFKKRDLVKLHPDNYPNQKYKTREP